LNRLQDLDFFSAERLVAVDVDERARSILAQAATQLASAQQSVRGADSARMVAFLPALAPIASSIPR
jgi:hypothetical protein